MRKHTQGNKQEITVPGGKGKAFHVSKGQTVTITDIEGKQVVDFIAFSSNNYEEYLSVTQTRTNLHQNFYLKKGDKLLTNYRNVIAEIVEDTVEIHDLLIAACDYYYYAEIGQPEHLSCAQNLEDAIKPYGIESSQRPDPFNIFQNTKINPDGSWFQDEPPSKAGDFIKLEFKIDALCAISVCPFDIDGFNDGKPTPIRIDID